MVSLDFQKYSRPMIAAAIAAASLLTSCGGGPNHSTPPPPASHSTYSIGGTVIGLAFGYGVSLQDNGVDTLTVTAKGSFIFATKLTSGSTYNITVWQQPTSPAASCTVANGSGTVTSDVTNVVVSCMKNIYSIGGTVTGLPMDVDSISLQNNGGDTLAMSRSGGFAFATKLSSGSTYNVTMAAQPKSGPNCTVSNGSGTATSNVSDVAVICMETTFSIGGTVIGLPLGDSFSLQDNGGETLTVSANGPFTFATRVPSYGPFNVTVAVQPATPGLNCTVSQGSGTAPDNVTTVAVACMAGPYSVGGRVVNLSLSNSVSLQNNGSDTLTVPANRTFNGTFTFATKLNGGSSYNVTAALQSTSPAQNCAVLNGSGTAIGNVTNVEVYCAYVAWTWMGGSSIENQPGAYGTEGTAAPDNIPGAREGAVSWTDKNGNLWLFGGRGFDSAGYWGELNDLWEYGNGEWTWVSGSKTVDQAGTYGTEGKAAPGNVPGAREGAVSWTDNNGNFWLCGGGGYDSAGSQGELNDLWEYSNGEWTWVSGSKTVDQAGTYGIEGKAAPGNVPGAREGAVSWTDNNGNFWLFGGLGYDSTRRSGETQRSVGVQQW